jgi:hypothetical protein
MEDQNKKPVEQKQETDKEPEETKKEIGGPKGPEPTRYGDWEKGGKCVDF